MNKWKIGPAGKKYSVLVKRSLEERECQGIEISSQNKLQKLNNKPREIGLNARHRQEVEKQATLHKFGLTKYDLYK